jgi:hypothetical protein
MQHDRDAQSLTSDFSHGATSAPNRKGDIMSHHAEDRDSIQSKLAQNLSESSRGGETLDRAVTEPAFDQEQRITRKPDDSVAQSVTAKQFSRRGLPIK